MQDGQSNFEQVDLSRRSPRLTLSLILRPRCVGIIIAHERIDPHTVPPRYLAKGNYFTLTVSTYPFIILCIHAGTRRSGIHLTLDLAGQARFGPDVEWVDEINYDVDSGRAQKFYAAIRRYWPELRDGSLMPAYSESGQRRQGKAKNKATS